MDAQTVVVAALSAIFGGGIIFRFGKKETPTHELERRLKEYFGGRFDGIAEDIKQLSCKSDKQDERYEKFYKEFTDVRIDLAKRFGRNGHD